MSEVENDGELDNHMSQRQTEQTKATQEGVSPFLPDEFLQDIQRPPFLPSRGLHLDVFGGAGAAFGTDFSDGFSFVDCLGHDGILNEVGQSFLESPIGKVISESELSEDRTKTKKKIRLEDPQDTESVGNHTLFDRLCGMQKYLFEQQNILVEQLCRFATEKQQMERQRHELVVKNHQLAFEIKQLSQMKKQQNELIETQQQYKVLLEQLNTENEQMNVTRGELKRQKAKHIEEKIKIGEQKKILAQERENLRKTHKYPNDVYLDKHVFYVRVDTKTYKYNILDPINVANFENKRLLSMSYMTFLFDKLAKSFKTSMSLNYTDDNIMVSANHMSLIHQPQIIFFIQAFDKANKLFEYEFIFME
jgi:hypothetical protein